MTRTETGWTVDLEDFEKKAKTLRCSFSAILIILWGIVWTAEDIQKMMKICQKYGLLVVSDEIHSDLYFPW